MNIWLRKEVMKQAAHGGKVLQAAAAAGISRVYLYKLLVRHGDKVARVDLSSWEQEDTDVPAWPSRVVSPDGKVRWLEAYQHLRQALEHEEDAWIIHNRPALDAALPAG